GSRRYRFSPGATKINGLDYYQLLFSNEESGYEWQGDALFFREDSQKVWIYNNGTEKLLYDFALEKGDTFRTDNQDDIYLIVADTDSIELLNGEKRKAIHLYCSNETDTVNYPWYGLQTWVEGIGYLSGILSENSYCMTDNTNTLLCFYNNGEMLYSNPDHTYCWTSGVEDFPEEEAIIFPNPIHDYLRFSADTNIDWQKMVILDMFGNKVFSKNISGYVQDQIDISILPAGTYVLKITDTSNKHIVLKKFTKM
ncbi:MAG TPA: T9SS type A sorting domain-containing protein, partial [Bacteroidetes bacterium]|nr:T9SS type A sorting domain-containing protein [Bacteroidota bacterium]